MAVVEKNAKMLVSEHCQREHITPTYQVTSDPPEGQPQGFFCALTIGTETYTIPEREKTKKAAETSAAKVACNQLNLIQQFFEVKKTKAAEKAILDAATPVKTPMVKDPSWITIEKVEDIYKYLTDEVLAQEFKAFLHCKSQEEKKDYPQFTIEEVGDKGFEGTVLYDGVEYKSLGVMMTRRQAEQSAAEVCLRTLGDFPAVEKDKYVIQVYRGGQVHVPGKNAQNMGHGLAAPNEDRGPMYGFFSMCAGNLNLQYPMLAYKKDESGETPTYVCALTVEGKTFQTTAPLPTANEAKEAAAVLALNYLGFTNLEEGSDFKNHIVLRKRRNFTPNIGQWTFGCGQAASPLLYCPSNRTGWIFMHHESLDKMTGKRITKGDDRKSLIRIKRSKTEDIDTIFERAQNGTPSVGGTAIETLEDISVGEEDPANKSFFIVGNKNISIPMYCEEGNIACSKGNKSVILKPGDNIRGLKCSYQIMYPSLQVYLKAESCTEVVNKPSPLPVLSSCGVVVILYDHQANVQDLNVLLTRPSTKLTFSNRKKQLAGYLNKLMRTASETTAPVTDTSSPASLDVPELFQTVATWETREVELLSQMTLESMKELMSVHVKFNERWAEIFSRELTDTLKEIKAGCAKELERRKSEGHTEFQYEPWTLPHARMEHNFYASGIFLESSLQCAFRSIVQTTGIKVKLGELETCPFIDVPSDETATQTGNICRYYIWKGIKKVPCETAEPYYEPNDVVDDLGEGWVGEEGYNKQKRSNKNKNRNNNRNNNQGPRKRRFHDNNENQNDSSEAKKEKGSDDIATVEADEALAKKPIEDEKTPQKPGSVQGSQQFSWTPIHLECRWFSLEEGKALSTALSNMVGNASFKKQVTALQIEANTFWQEKQSS